MASRQAFSIVPSLSFRGGRANPVCECARVDRRSRVSSYAWKYSQKSRKFQIHVDQNVENIISSKFANLIIRFSCFVTNLMPIKQEEIVNR